MATILFAFGINVNPGVLNDSMRQNSGFSGANVNWTFIDKFSGNDKIMFGGDIGKNMVRDSLKGLDTIKSIPLDLSMLDSHISKGEPVIVQVANVRSSGRVSGHWVVVVGKDNTKIGMDAYKIFDPGSTTNCKNRTLSSYNGKIYRYIYYKAK